MEVLCISPFQLLPNVSILLVDMLSLIARDGACGGEDVETEAR